MTASSYRIEAYWGPRKESAEECGLRLAQMLKSLAAIHPAFGQWNKQGETRETANQRFCVMPPDPDELAQAFDEGISRRDATGEAWPELGYWLSAWNGIDGPNGVSTRIRAGSFSSTPIFPNCVEIDPHRADFGNERLLSTEVLKPALLSITAAWEPLWASISSWEYWRRLFPATQPWPRFRSGWMTYLAEPYARKITPPPPAIVELVVGGGILMLATNEPFDLDNPQHVAAADAIQDALAPLQADPLLSQ